MIMYLDVHTECVPSPLIALGVAPSPPTSELFSTYLRVILTLFLVQHVQDRLGYALSLLSE